MVTVFVILLSLLFLFPGCSNSDKNIECNDVANITIHYLPKKIDPGIPISDCHYIFKYEPVLKTIIISDRDFICNLVSIINNLKISSKETYRDFRIMVLLKKKNGRINRLCIGEDDLIEYDGVIMKNERELF